MYSIEEERKVYDNLSSWDSIKFDKAYSVDKLDKDGNQVFKINNQGQVETVICSALLAVLREFLKIIFRMASQQATRLVLNAALKKGWCTKTAASLVASVVMQNVDKNT